MSRRSVVPGVRRGQSAGKCPRSGKHRLDSGTGRAGLPRSDVLSRAALRSGKRHDGSGQMVPGGSPKGRFGRAVQARAVLRKGYGRAPGRSGIFPMVSPGRMASSKPSSPSGSITKKATASNKASRMPPAGTGWQRNRETPRRSTVSPSAVKKATASSEAGRTPSTGIRKQKPVGTRMRKKRFPVLAGADFRSSRSLLCRMGRLLIGSGVRFAAVL